ncbi:MAG: hypothetical protein SVK54_02265 [candidate division WOR-3 bacterium]|nr:hypothetical protein [candidate division WOR-3 bacterium]
MAHSYTPGLKVTQKAMVRKDRRLPLKGDVLVEKGDILKAEQIVARTELPGDVERLNFAGKIGATAKECKNFLTVEEGDEVKKGQIVGESSGFFGLFKTHIKSPIDGTMESLSEITGMMTLRHPPKPIEVNAYINGRVVELIEDEGVTVESPATFIQGIFGIGGEEQGEIVVVADSNDYVLKENDITDKLKDKIIIGGSLITASVLKKCVEVGAKGVIVGGIDDKDLKNFLGEEIGVAITGNEEKGITLIITEGFGEMHMAAKTFEILKGHNGRIASINGATQIRAGVLRPELIVTHDDEIDSADFEKSHESNLGMDIGSVVRVIREPNFGRIGKVSALPAQLEKIETEAKVRVLEVEFEEGRKVLLPRANVELIEE